MSTYGELKTKFLARMNRRDLTNDTTGLADGFMQDAITRIQRIQRVPAIERVVDVILDNTTYFTPGKLAIPSDYLMLKFLKANQRTILKRRDIGFVLSLANNNVGEPTVFAREGNGWILGPKPLAGFTDANGNPQSSQVRIVYYAEFPT